VSAVDEKNVKDGTPRWRQYARVLGCCSLPLPLPLPLIADR
jgi:hypothetical protein